MQILMRIFSQHQTKHPWWTHKENQINKIPFTHTHIHIQKQFLCNIKLKNFFINYCIFK